VAYVIKRRHAREHIQLILALVILGLAIVALAVAFQQRPRTGFFAAIVFASGAGLLAGTVASGISIVSMRMLNTARAGGRLLTNRQALFGLMGPILLWEVITLVFSLKTLDDRQGKLELAFLLLGWASSLTILWFALRWRHMSEMPTGNNAGPTMKNE
jgi:hypothetical protein